MSQAIDSQSVEGATTALTSAVVQPDSKTRRYDRQLRLWAASGQSALESARVLVIGGSATSASVLKNLVLPGIGHFTLLDPSTVKPEDAGNNFFLHQSSIGQPRAVEVVKYLSELNESVEGVANENSLPNLITKDPAYLTSFTLVIAHNLSNTLLTPLSSLLWETSPSPPLIIIRSAGFLGDFTIQFHEHTIIDSHSETPPSLCVDSPFPALLSHSLNLDFDALDLTDHGNVPYVIILVKAMHNWKQSHGGNPPKTYAERQEFKNSVYKLKKKDDEENFDEAVAQAFKAWTPTTVPGEIEALFKDPQTVNLTSSSPPFFLLVHALYLYTLQSPYNLLPLSPTLPDMKSDTTSYIHLQSLYKAQANADKAKFVEILKGVIKGKQGGEVALGMVDEFVKNCHALKVLRGRRWGGGSPDDLLSAINSDPGPVATHLALSALFNYEASRGHFPTPGSSADLQVLTKLVKDRLASAGWEDTSAPVEEDEEEGVPPTFSKFVLYAVGEVARAPTADLPTTAALLGGFVAQEAIKLITSQYVPIDGTCAVDLVTSTTGTIKV